ncbi:MAG: hypothetical protein LBB47_01640 [Spirochaetaceae bacterium]|nr:hypothetical protein [Spirochaetaceae bacterium]
MKRVCLLPIALALTCNTLFAQMGGVVFAPFISWLKADVNGSEVRLSWTDSNSVKGPVYIYRSSTPLKNTYNISMNQGVEVPHGTGRYTDIVPFEGVWYYFVVASDEQKKKYDLLIPFNNTIDVTVGRVTLNNPVTSTGNDAYAPVFYGFSGTQVTPEPSYQVYGNSGSGQSVAPAGNLYEGYRATQNTGVQSVVTGIKATAYPDGIEITFNSPDPNKSAVLYRSIQPLRGFSDLLSATVAALRVKSPYMDRVNSGAAYYYAVVYEDDIMNGHGQIYPGSNATLMPAEVSSNAPVQGPSASGAPSYSGGIVTIDESASTKGRGANAVDTYPTYRSYSRQADDTLILKEPRVFNRDMQTSGSDPDDKRLALIVQGPFMWRDWQAARTDLTDFIVEAANGAAESRARFYIAQCWYFIGDIRMALSVFLKLQRVYPEESELWIQACLNKLSER